MIDVAWSEGRWTNDPVAVKNTDNGLVITAAFESDAWRHTEYGFVHDTEHALVAPFAVGEAMEVDFVADFDQEFDQAGVFVRASDELWVKAGLEYSDGALQCGAVVTDVNSDWSVAPVPDWAGRVITVRVSRSETALTFRIGVDGGPLRLLRLSPFAAELDAEAGPMLCGPTREGLTVTFTGWRRGEADSSLH